MTILHFTFRGGKHEIELTDDLTVHDIKSYIIARSVPDNANVRDNDDADERLAIDDIRIVFQGKVLSNNDELIIDRIAASNKSESKSKNTLTTTTTTQIKKKYNLFVTATSSATKRSMEEEMKTMTAQNRRLVRDDLTATGMAKERQRKLRGQRVLQQQQRRHASAKAGKYGFGSIEVLPNLPKQEQARSILTQLANDPGILACMNKHRWNVGSLAELYPDGNVGQSAVCVMGLNRNKGQQILLRLRTDDLSGFRKILSIRKVLFHELAHNVHSDHDNDFFQLMRQIEKECNEMDWTGGAGLSSSGVGAENSSNDGLGTDADVTTEPMNAYEGGAYRLGGAEQSLYDPNATASTTTENRSPRELAAAAAISRMMTTEEAMEIEQNCGCGSQQHRSDLFLPTRMDVASASASSPSDSTTAMSSFVSSREHGHQMSDGSLQGDRGGDEDGAGAGAGDAGNMDCSE